jgi:hypothetical protein
VTRTPVARGLIGTSRPDAESSQTGAAPSGARPKLLDLVRDAIRIRHYSERTEQAYVHWIKRFIVFEGMRHPAQVSEDEVTRYLSHLATTRQVSASTQNQAFNALLFLYLARSWGSSTPSAPSDPRGCRLC